MPWCRRHTRSSGAARNRARRSGDRSATLWRFYRRFAERGSALLLTIGYAFGTMALPFSILLFSHAISAALLFWAFMLLYRPRGEPGDPSPGWAPVVLAGILAGYAIGCEYPTAIIGFLLGLYVLWPQRRLVLSQPASIPATEPRPRSARRYHPTTVGGEQAMRPQESQPLPIKRAGLYALGIL